MRACAHTRMCLLTLWPRTNVFRQEETTMAGPSAIGFIHIGKTKGRSAAAARAAHTALGINDDRRTGLH